MQLLDKKAIEAIRRIGRAADPSESTAINQHLLDSLCGTALLGAEALEIVQWWRELQKDGYSLRVNEIEQIEALLKKVRAFKRTGEL